MAQSTENTGAGPVSIESEFFVCNEPLNGPFLEFRPKAPITLTLRTGVKITLPSGVALYVHPNELSQPFFTSLQSIAAEAQIEEEERWMRMTPEKLAEARAGYVPF